MNPRDIYVVIMAGGIGSRFWPMSRTRMPKQFLDILNRGQSLIQETFERMAQLAPPDNIYVVTNDRYLDLVREQLPGIAPQQILLEPVGRNTAPCVAYAAHKIHQANPNAVLVVTPADHLVMRDEELLRVLRLGAEAASGEDRIMTLGITPTRPDTGYGYIQFLEDHNERGYFKVKTFTEKPTLEVARSFLESGDYVWNSGLFIFSSQTILGAFHQYLPDVSELFQQISAAYFTPEEADAIGRVYSMCPSVSIDYGIMEKAGNVYVVPANFGWSDLGTWASVYDTSDKDPQGNVVHGRKAFHSSANNMVSLENKEKLVMLRNLNGYIVVDTEDALIICPLDEEQSIKQMVADLKPGYGDRYL